MTSWLGTKTTWTPVRFDDNIFGHAVILPYRRSRLPWLKHQSKLLVAIHESQHLLLLYKHDRIPHELLAVSSALLELKPANFCLSQVAEFFEFPAAECIYSEFSGLDLGDVNPKSMLADECLKQWNKDPIPGWWPVHRGVAGLSFLRDVVTLDNMQCSVEIQASDMILYKGTVEENMALQSNRIRRRWGMHDMETERLRSILSVDSLVQSRMLMRRYRYWIYEYLLHNELPF